MEYLLFRLDIAKKNGDVKLIDALVKDLVEHYLIELLKHFDNKIKKDYKFTSMKPEEIIDRILRSNND